MTTEDGLPPETSTDWDAVIDDANALAEDYRENSWDAFAVHTGDVTPLTGERFGLSVLIPGSEYERVSDLVDEHTFDRSHVYRQSGTNWTFLLCAFEATDEGVAVLVPAFVSATETALRTQAEEAGELPIHVRPLSEDERVIFIIADPSLVFEPES